MKSACLHERDLETGYTHFKNSLYEGWVKILGLEVLNMELVRVGARIGTWIQGNEEEALPRSQEERNSIGLLYNPRNRYSLKHPSTSQNVLPP